MVLMVVQLRDKNNAPINVMPHLPQVRPSRERGRELVPRFCPMVGTIPIFCDISPRNAIVNGKVRIHII